MTKLEEALNAWRAKYPEDKPAALKCASQRFGQDQYRCLECGMVWDVDEPRPPCQYTVSTKDAPQ